ncbi:hypothetical protein RJ639_039040 [Escallonia herrerae]|uniref:Uncharacterized protein n=1 Tax=Escallonia herrerae TaxID=1293975 RepID=A0AA88WNY2_9ASTE|nr:hypothetical protein RJ639_039040 [Escallonia herrerae]
MEIDSTDNSNWLFDYGLMEDISAVSGVVFPPAAAAAAPTIGFSWPQEPLNCSSNVSADIDGSLVDSEGFKEGCSRKRYTFFAFFLSVVKYLSLYVCKLHNIAAVCLDRLKSESCNASGTKACREKKRRDKLNERHDIVFFSYFVWFLELCSILEPGRPPKTDKAAILNDAVRMVTQLRSEAQKLKESNEDFQEKIKELKAEKNELRDEKQRLKGDKEKLEQQVKALSSQPGFLPHPSAMGAAFAAQGQAAGNKLMPFVSYPGLAMWQFMPPAVVDTSQDHVLRPPVA